MSITDSRVVGGSVSGLRLKEELVVGVLIGNRPCHVFRGYHMYITYQVGRHKCTPRCMNSIYQCETDIEWLDACNSDGNGKAVYIEAGEHPSIFRFGFVLYPFVKVVSWAFLSLFNIHLEPPISLAYLLGNFSFWGA